MVGHMLKKALIKVGYTCNNDCMFCHSAPIRKYPDLTTTDIKSKIKSAKTAAADMVVFSGGEPTIRKDIVELVNYAGSIGLKTGFVTNGRRFTYYDFAKRLSKSGFCFAYLSFHSASPETHRLSTRTDSFYQVLGAIKNLEKLKTSVVVNTVVTKYNIDSLRKIVDLLVNFRLEKIKFSVLEPKGSALNTDDILPTLKVSAKAIPDATDYGRSRYPDFQFGCEGLTPCLLDDFDTFNDDLFTNNFILFSESFEKKCFPPDYGNRSKSDDCLDCARYDNCPGIFTGYFSMEESLPITPIIHKRSNSFIFLKRSKSLPFPENANTCPVRNARRREDIRRIFLRERNQIYTYRTPTKDFPDKEISETVRNLGQIYAISGGKHTELDHGRDLIKLRLASVCRKCGKKQICPGIYEKSAENVFTPIESELEDIIQGLEGTVLEIGCGAIRFREIIESRVREGNLKYVGIDPELPNMHTPEGINLLRMDIERYEAPDSAFDHILILRSYNHIRRLSVALNKIHGMLKLGGTLTVVDGIAYGLVLSRKPPAANGSGAFQHFRNHSLQQAKKALELFGFTAIKEIPVSFSGCNEWLLTVKKDEK